MQLSLHRSHNDADTFLAEHLIHLISYTIQLTGSAVVGLSGGSTPQALYQELQSLPDVLAESTHFIQMDERFVASDHERSNQRMIRELLKPVNFSPMVVDSESVSTAAQESSLKYKSLMKKLGKETLDISLLGMGTDGHTASMFPYNQTYLDQINQKITCFGTFVVSQKENRLSLSSHQINNSWKILYLKGEDKLQTLQDAILSRDLNMYPVLSILQDCEVHAVVPNYNSFEAVAKLINLEDS